MFYRILERFFQVVGVLSTMAIGGFLIFFFALDSNRDDTQYDFMSDVQIRSIFEGNKNSFYNLVELSIPCNKFSRGAMHFNYPRICSELSDQLSIYEYSFVKGNRYFYTNRMQQGFQKGFAYLEQEPEIESKLSFDDFPQELNPYENHYKSLEGKWYIVAYSING